MKFFTLLISLLATVSVYGQSRIEGRVTNQENEPLPAAQVDLLQADSSVIASLLTDQEGHYLFERAGKGSRLVKVTYLGCPPEYKKVMLFESTQLTVDFRISDQVLLDEVTVRGTGIIARGDTTSYVVQQFVSGTERTLKDVLEKLPNLSVDEANRSVTANGKQVSRILLEDQDLFQGNVAVPMENLSAEGIKKIDVIENYSEYDIFDGFRTSDETVINVGVTDNMRNKLKGELELAGGVKSSYNARATSLYIGRKSMFSGMLLGNNVGNRLLRFQDVVKLNGGYSTLLSGNNPVTDINKKMEAYAPFMDNRQDVYRRNNGLLSLNYIYRPNKKVMLSMTGIYGMDGYRSWRNQRYEYLSGLQYGEELSDRNRRNHGLMNVKLQYLPHKDFNLIYTGNVLYAAHRTTSESLRSNNRLLSKTTPQTWDVKQNLLLVKRWGENTLNLSIDYADKRMTEELRFTADSLFYPESLLLASAYQSRLKESEHQASAQLFYLHRLNKSYFFRVGWQSLYNHQTFSSLLLQEPAEEGYDNHLTVSYWDHSLGAMFSKDKGKLKGTAALNLHLLHAQGEAIAALPTREKAYLAPSLQLNYAFSTMQHLILNYDYGKSMHPVNVFAPHPYLKQYNSILTSQVSELYSSRHKLSLTHMWMQPYIGITWMNMAGYEHTEHPLISNHTQIEQINATEKRVYSDVNTCSWLTSFEYKFLKIPLNVRLVLNCLYNDAPLFNNDQFYDAGLLHLSGGIQLQTYYKSGFNGKLKADVSSDDYQGLPAGNSMLTSTLNGELTWTHKRLYAAVDVLYRNYRLNGTTTENMYYGFEVRYKLNKSLQLTMIGKDVFHLGERVQASGVLDAYYTAESNVRYMPGYITCGVTLKY
jgi:hypothetical protein